MGRFKNVGAALSSTDLTVIYTCPTNFTAIIREVFITNVDATHAVDMTLSWTDTSASATYSLLNTHSIDADSYLRFNEAQIVLESGDILKAQAGAANDAVVSVFIEELLRPQG